MYRWLAGAVVGNRKLCGRTKRTDSSEASTHSGSHV